MTNIMKNIKIEKVTINMGVGSDADSLERGKQVIESITNTKCIKTKAKIKLPTWDIRPGLEIGLKTTLRGKNAVDFLDRALKAKDNILKKKNFDKTGNFGFGIAEHIDLPEVKYDPRLGIMGFNVLVTLERPGYRIKKRKIKKTAIGKNHLITRNDAISFIQEKFGAKVE